MQFTKVDWSTQRFITQSFHYLLLRLDLVATAWVYLWLVDLGSKAYDKDPWDEVDVQYF